MFIADWILFSPAVKVMLLIDPTNNLKAIEFLLVLDPSFLNQNLKVSFTDGMISSLHCARCRPAQRSMRTCNRVTTVQLRSRSWTSTVLNANVFGHRRIYFKPMDHPGSINLKHQHFPIRTVIPRQLVKTINSDDDDDQNPSFSLVSFFFSFSTEKSMRTVHIRLL